MYGKPVAVACYLVIIRISAASGGVCRIGSTARPCTGTRARLHSASSLYKKRQSGVSALHQPENSVLSSYRTGFFRTGQNLYNTPARGMSQLQLATQLVMRLTSRSSGASAPASPEGTPAGSWRTRLATTSRWRTMTSGRGARSAETATRSGRSASTSRITCGSIARW